MFDRIIKKLAQQKMAMAVILRDVAGHNWGWFSREDPRMHLQTVDLRTKDTIKVWLETVGKRDFVLAKGTLEGKEYRELFAEVQSNREYLENLWAAFMIDNGWLSAVVKGDVVLLTAYPKTNSSFQRKIELRKEFPGAFRSQTQGYNRPGWDGKNLLVDLDSENALLAVGPAENPDERNHLLLSKILFVG